MMYKFVGKLFIGIFAFLFAAMPVVAGRIQGRVIDGQSREPLIGAIIQIKNSSEGASTDIDGHYSLSLDEGTYSIVATYLGYKSLSMEGVKVGDSTVLDFEMENESTMLGEVQVTARMNRENEQTMQLERRQSTLAIENMGAKEMNIKGIGNVQDGVKKLTGISVADAGQLIVRGLGDRYSSTTLNGLPIASPNPDNKLIPLNLFSASTVQNITVNKVYDAATFADYSGAHIDISTKENVTADFFTISVGTGGEFNTLGSERFQMNRNGLLFRSEVVDKTALSLPLVEFDNYVKTTDIFATSFDVEKKFAAPEMNVNLGFGKNFTVANHTLGILASVAAGNEYQNIKNAFYRTLEASGTVQDAFAYNSFGNTQKITALGHIGYTLRSADRIGYTFFYSRHASDTYQRRDGVDAEGHNLVGSNNVTHIYSLSNHQINGVHKFGDNDRWELTYGGSYTSTGSEEPDRRQMMFERGEDGSLSLFKLNRQETMRYFGNLDEKEWNAKAAVKMLWNENSFVKIGFDYKNKDRDYSALRFYYNLNRINPEIDDIYNPGEFINQANVADGNVVIQRVMQPKDSYRAANDIYAAYILGEFYPVSDLLVNIGVRYERSSQWVEYASDGGNWYEKRRDLNSNDIFPTLNLKYILNANNTMRFSASRTVTRPSFIEMAPFLYQESYGSAQIRGNEDLANGYNYNFDLRYEHFSGNSDMLSLTAYFKYLDKPIERIQALQGGATLHSFQNADSGMAGGVELEVRRQIVNGLRIGANVSYMYTNVKLPQGGAYTNKERPLQGASPILANADITYSPVLAGGRKLNVALLYNLQGSRIHAVGIAGLGDVKQQTLHTLNFSAGYAINRHCSVSVQLNDILNRDVVFRQQVPSTGNEMEVERYKTGIGFEIGFKYNL